MGGAFRLRGELVFELNLGVSEGYEIEVALVSLLYHLQHYLFQFLEALGAFGRWNREYVEDVENLDAVGATDCGVFTHIGRDYPSALKLIVTSDRTVVVVERAV